MCTTGRGIAVVRRYLLGDRVRLVSDNRWSSVRMDDFSSSGQRFGQIVKLELWVVQVHGHYSMNVGLARLFGGLVFTAIDWHNDFELSRPSIIRIRALIPGLILLFTEAIVVLGANTKPQAFQKKDDQIALPFLKEWSTRGDSFSAGRRIKRELGEVECVF